MLIPVLICLFFGNVFRGKIKPIEIRLDPSLETRLLLGKPCWLREDWLVNTINQKVGKITSGSKKNNEKNYSRIPSSDIIYTNTK